MNPLLGMFGVGPTELLVVGVVVLLLFGSRLPSVMRSLGRSVVEFKKGVKEIEEDGDDESPSEKS
jgi:sec-independent protein translocase protein TatA